MRRLVVLSWLATMFLLLTSVFALAPREARAADGDLKVETKYPILQSVSGSSFSFDVAVSYNGTDRKRFDISLTPPKDWVSNVSAGYPQKQVTAFELGPATKLPDKEELSPATESVSVTINPANNQLPDPGDYVATLKISSGTLSQSIELTAKVTAKYEFSLYSSSGKLNMEATAGKENHFSIQAANYGSAAIENITFSSSKPEGWVVTFSPDKIASLEAGLQQEVDVVIKPPSGKTIAGDYAITLSSSGANSYDNIELRVTVLTPSVWGWVGIGIVVLVIVGMAAVFKAYGRR